MNERMSERKKKYGGKKRKNINCCWRFLFVFYNCPVCSVQCAYCIWHIALYLLSFDIVRIILSRLNWANIYVNGNAFFFIDIYRHNPFSCVHLLINFLSTLNVGWLVGWLYVCSQMVYFNFINWPFHIGISQASQ